MVFYVVVAAKKLDLNDLRTAGWIFDMGSSVHEPWYQFYSYFGEIFFSFRAFVCIMVANENMVRRFCQSKI
jgi:hypothetical protein